MPPKKKGTTSDSARSVRMKKISSNRSDEILKRLSETERENDHLKAGLLTDDLTGLYNKRFFNIQLEGEIARAKRTGQPCTLMIMDVDNFKSINEGFGREAGDGLLVHIGGIIWRNIQPVDFACRLADDIFSVIMPASNLVEGINVAKGIRSALDGPEAALQARIGKRISMSFGLAVYEPLSHMSVDGFFASAEAELATAKKSGKDRISCGSVRWTEKEAVSGAEREALSQFNADAEG